MPRRLDPDEARILERFKRLAPQRDALAVALQPFGDGKSKVFDRAAWRRAFASDDPETIVAVTAVTGLFEDGGLTANQATVLLRLYRTRNELQHASVDVEADQIHDDIVLLQKTLGRFAKSYVEWLERHDIWLLPRRR
jgi:hypothetical protein